MDEHTAKTSNTDSQPDPQPPVNTGQQNNESVWAMLCHLTSLLLFLGVPFGNLLGPLVVWLIKRNDYPLVDDQGKESLNFQISLYIYAIISFILMFVLVGFLLLFIVIVMDVLFVVIASVQASKGERYRYPLTIRFIR